RQLIDLQMAFGSYEVGVIQRTPVPNLSGQYAELLGKIAEHCVSLKRELDSAIEISHAFILPGLLQVGGENLASRTSAWSQRVSHAESMFVENQRRIDELARHLYGFTEHQFEHGVGKPSPTAGIDQEQDKEQR